MDELRRTLREEFTMQRQMLERKLVQVRQDKLERKHKDLKQQFQAPDNRTVTLNFAATSLDNKVCDSFVCSLIKID